MPVLELLKRTGAAASESARAKVVQPWPLGLVSAMKSDMMGDLLWLHMTQVPQ